MSAAIVRLLPPFMFLLLPVVAGAQENLKFLPPPEWQLANTQQQGDRLLMEFVKKGEQIESWTELLTMQQFRRSKGSPSPRDFYDQSKALREKECPGVSEWQTIEEEPMFLYEWTMTATCQGHPPQSELVRLVFAKNTGYRVAFTARGSMTPETRATWIEWLRGLSMMR